MDNWDDIQVYVYKDLSTKVVTADDEEFTGYVDEPLNSPHKWLNKMYEEHVMYELGSGYYYITSKRGVIHSAPLTINENK